MTGTCTPERCLEAERPMIARSHTPRTCPERIEPLDKPTDSGSIH